MVSTPETDTERGPREQQLESLKGSPERLVFLSDGFFLPFHAEAAYGCPRAQPRQGVGSATEETAARLRGPGLSALPSSSEGGGGPHFPERNVGVRRLEGPRASPSQASK